MNFFKRKMLSETLIKTTVPIGGVLGAAGGVMMATTMPGMVAAGAIGALAGGVVLPVVSVAGFFLAKGLVHFVKNEGRMIFLLTAAVIGGVLDTAIKKITHLFSRKKNQSPNAPSVFTEKKPSLASLSAKDGFNSEATPALSIPQLKAAPASPEPKV